MTLTVGPLAYDVPYSLDPASILYWHIPDRPESSCYQYSYLPSIIKPPAWLHRMITGMLPSSVRSMRLAMLSTESKEQAFSATLGTMPKSTNHVRQSVCISLSDHYPPGKSITVFYDSCKYATTPPVLSYSSHRCFCHNSFQLLALAQPTLINRPSRVMVFVHNKAKGRKHPHW